MKIDFDGIKNARDLGGIMAYDGRTVKSGRLIRSGRLFSASKRDIKKLEAYNLNAVIDFRNKAEVEKEPDVLIKGAEYINLPPIDDTNESTIIRGREIELLKQYYKEPDVPIKKVLSVYKGLVSEDIALKAYSEFLRAVLSYGDGAVLWHCSYGKDRAATAAAILLSALGVSRKEIMKDYLLTNALTEKSVRMSSVLLMLRTHSRKYIPLFKKMMRADESYMSCQFKEIDTVWGGNEGFLRDGLKISGSDIDALKHTFLEQKPL